MDLDARRAELNEAGLDVADLDPDPFVMFGRWFDDARSAGVHEPEGMVVSTVAGNGQPSSRLVLMRDWSGGAITFFTNYESQKGHELAENPLVSLCFPWNVIGRQVRVGGRAARSTDAASDAYFASRARDSQIGAWASAQSSVLASRAELEARVAEVEERFAGVDVPRPPYWGGFRVDPFELEFWQGRRSRLHDRFRYRREHGGDTWIIERLSP
jgi:pyridoxamine 5'-phosphate oxidase